MKKMMKKHPVRFSILIAFILAGIWSFGRVLLAALIAPLELLAIIYLRPEFLPSIFMDWLVCGAFLVYPIILTIANFCMMIARPIEEKIIRTEKRFEYTTIILGVIYSCGLYLFSRVVFTVGETETLRNSRLNSSIWTGNYLIVIAVAFVGIIGYLILSWITLKKMPPLVIVFSIAAMYLGTGECILWIIQIQGAGIKAFILSVFLFNCIVITIKTIRRKVWEWNEMEENIGSDYENNHFLGILNRKLNNAKNWPLAALILMLPLLGIMICILVLFGQKT